MQIEHTRGLIAAPFTPMTIDGQVNPDRIEQQVEFLTRNGVVGAFVCGTTGEGLSLSTDERIQVAQLWIDLAPKGFRVIVHVGHTSLPECKRLAEHAQRTSAFGIAAMSPFFFRPRSVEILVDFCRQVASAAPSTPFYYYHIPSMTGVDLPIAEFLRIGASRIPTLAGMKFTHTHLPDYTACRLINDGQYDMLFGIDQMLVSALQEGAIGAVGTNYNLMAPLFLRLMEAWQKGNLDLARQLQRQANQVIDILLHAPCGFHTAAKYAMKIIGLDCGPVRLPLCNPSPQEFDKLSKSLGSAGLFQIGCK